MSQYSQSACQVRRSACPCVHLHPALHAGAGHRWECPQVPLETSMTIDCCFGLLVWTPRCCLFKVSPVLTALHLVLQMDSSVPGYQAPLPADQVKPLQEGPAPSASQGGNGDGTGRGRGPGRGRRGRWALLIQLFPLMHLVVLGCCCLSLAPSYVFSCGQVKLRSSAAGPLTLRSSALCMWRPEHVATRADSALSPAQRCAWETGTTLLLCFVPCTLVHLRWALPGCCAVRSDWQAGYGDVKGSCAAGLLCCEEKLTGCLTSCRGRGRGRGRGRQPGQAPAPAPGPVAAMAVA